MREFGSDFHYIETFNSAGTHLPDLLREATLLADGRQCIVALIRQYGWKRIWMPDYFCYEVIDSVREQTGIEVVFYEDNPFDEAQVVTLPFQEGDVLLRMNYFGLRGFRSNKDIPCPVIEDHTHNLVGEWALNSDADWCIASVRKSLPVPEGGVMWSPKGYQLEITINTSEDNEQIAAIRWKGMELKASYLMGGDVSKEAFRKCFTETEEWFDRAETSLMDGRSRAYLSETLDVDQWQEARRRNWLLLKTLVNTDACTVLRPENETCTMFSLMILLNSRERRDIVRKRLIDSCVYPAILWTVPENASASARVFSERMLSIHCDGRYSEDDIRQLAHLVNEALEAK